MLAFPHLIKRSVYLLINFKEIQMETIIQNLSIAESAIG